MSKNLSVNGDLLTRLLGEGADVSKNKIVLREHDESFQRICLYESLTSFDEIWEQLLKEDTKNLEWETDKANDTYVRVDQRPGFPGGEKALLEYLQKNAEYPVDTHKEGRVLVSFDILTDGSITNVKIMRSLDPNCDNEAVRLVKNMPKWNPGKNNGEPVNVYYTLAITFSDNKVRIR